MAMVQHADARVYDIQYSFEKAKACTVTTVPIIDISCQCSISASETQSVDEEDKDTSIKGEHPITQPSYSDPPHVGTRQKIREIGRLGYTRAKVAWNDMHQMHLPISDAGWYHHRYVKPLFDRKAGVNKRITTSMWKPVATIANGSGKLEDVIQSASHNYAGFYERTLASEDLQRLALNCLPIASSGTAPNLETAMHEGLRALFQADFCTTISTGYGSNVLCFPAVLDETWVVLLDEKSHNSMLVAAYLAKPKAVRKFRHNDMTHLQQLLGQVQTETTNILVAVEGAYSMDGTVPPLNQLRKLKQKYNCVLLADEAHSLLSLGRTGRGCVEAWNDDHPHDAIDNELFDLRTATLSKSFGTIGGIVWGKQQFKDRILARRKQLLDEGSDPVATSVMVNTLFILGQPTVLVRRLRKLVHMVAHVRTEFQKAGMHVYGNSLAPVLPLHTGRPSQSAQFSYILRQHGVLATPVTPPAVPFWEGRVRLCLSAGFDNETVNQLVVRTVAAAQEIGLARKAVFVPAIFDYQEDELDSSEQSEILEVSKHIRELILQDATLQHDELVTDKDVTDYGHAMRQKFGLGSGGSRWIIGTSTLHLDVEKKCAALAGTEAAMTYADTYLGLLSTVAALCRPVRGYAKHYFFVPRDASPAVVDGIRAAPRKGLPVVESYDDSASLLQKVRSIKLGGKAYFTLYLSTTAAGSSANLTKLVQQLMHGRRPFSTTLLVDDVGGITNSGICIEHGRDLCREVMAKQQEILLYASFHRAFGLPGAVLAGSSIMLEELRFTSRTYMFSTSQQSFIMGMILRRLQMLESDV